MILTVTPNPAIDLTWHVDRLTPGATHRVPTGASRAGGKGLNAARVLHHGLLGRVQLWCRRNRHGTSNQAVHAAIGPPAADIRPRPTRRSPE